MPNVNDLIISRIREMKKSSMDNINLVDVFVHEIQKSQYLLLPQALGRVRGRSNATKSIASLNQVK